MRQDIFIIEQQCLYKDLDNLDLRCTHILLVAGQAEGHSLLQGCLRIVPPRENSAEVALGRLAVRASVRSKGLGAELVRAGIETAAERYPELAISLSGQAHLQKFYESLGFVGEGSLYDEDGIPHRKFNYQP